MKAVIIGASEEALHTIEKAKKYGLFVTALDGNPKAQGLWAADQAIVVDISDEKAAIEAVSKEGADFVLTAPIGRYLTTIGAVNDALKLPGISREMAVLCTDKYQFHQRLKEQKLRNCHCYAVGNQEDEISCDEMADRLGSGELPLSFPAILKPRYGSGSRGIHLSFDMAELQSALMAVKGESYVLEESVQGEEYGIDGAVTGGRFQMVLLRKKENTPLPARQAVAYYSVLPTDPFWQQAKEHMKKVIACLGLQECLVHADIIRTEASSFVIELSARPSGHNLHNLFTPLCTGVDMAEEYIKYRMGKPYCFEPLETKRMMIHYFDMQGKVRQVPDRKQIEQMILANAEESREPSKAASLVEWECHIREGEILGPVSDGHSLMGRGYFILEGSAGEELSVLAERIKGLF